MKKFIFLFFFSLNAMAATENLSLPAKDVSVSKSAGEFSKLSVKGFELTNKVGAPAVPVKSWLLVGKPEDIRVRLNVLKSQTLKNVMPYPAQPEECRCETDKVRKFEFNKSLYANNESYELSYIGDFRGTHITRLDVFMANYDAKSNSTQVLNDVEVNYNASIYELRSESYNDYLIIATEKLAAGTAAFVEWKRAQGYNVMTEVLSGTPTLDAVAALIKKHYDQGADFVILVGDETEIPMYRVSTSGSSQTPSDLKYFTMGGASDNIADMFSSRIVAASPAAVTGNLAKAIEFDKKTYKNTLGLGRMIGIASNEGSNPSDNEYVLSMEKAFKDTWNIDAGHLYQNNADSTPTTLNKYLSDGALWMFYLGHGSGTSWPSMKQSYSVTHIPSMNNFESVKPVIVDVACMNGKLKAGYLGAEISKVTSATALGSAAYYGGSVNISWHPPAVMARGIAFEHTKNNYKHLGEALLAGQLYLAANWTDQNAILDNYEWYHLQGDPGMLIGQ